MPDPYQVAYAALSIYQPTESHFSIYGSHAYAQPGTYPIHIFVTSVRGASTTIDSGVDVIPIPPPTAQGTSLTAFAGLLLADPVVATYSDFTLPGVASLGTYSATIDWGDGTSSTAAVGQFVNPTGSGTPPILTVFTAYGAHAYASAGQYQATVTFRAPDGRQFTANSTINVLPAPPLSATGNPNLFGTAGQAPVSALATVSVPGVGSPNDYSATIDWGDGSTSSASNVSGFWNPDGFASDDPRFRTLINISGDHAYANPGTYAIVIDIHRADGSEAKVTSQANIGGESTSQGGPVGGGGGSILWTDLPPVGSSPTVKPSIIALFERRLLAPKHFRPVVRHPKPRPHPSEPAHVVRGPLVHQHPRGRG